MDKSIETRAIPMSERSADTDLNRHSRYSRSADTEVNRYSLTSAPSDASERFAFTKRLDSKLFDSVSTMSKRPQEVPDNLVEQVASAVTSAIELQFHDMTDTLVAAIRGSYQQESTGLVSQLSSRVVAGLAPELAKAVLSTNAHTDQTHLGVTSSRRQSRCLTAASRHSSQSRSNSSFTSSSKASSRRSRDARAVADGLATETLISQGLMASSSDREATEAWLTRRQHDVSNSFLTAVLPEESHEQESSSAPNLTTSECESESFHLNVPISVVVPTPRRAFVPREPAGDGPKLVISSNDGKPNVQTASDVLQVRVQELTEQFVYQDDQAAAEEDVQPRSNFGLALLKLSGIVGWDSSKYNAGSLIYQRIVLFLTLLAVVYLTYGAASVVQAYSSMHVVEVRERSLLLCDIAMAFGSLMGLFSMRPWKGSATVCKVLTLLDAYSQRLGLLERWRNQVFRETLGTCALWLLVIGSTWTSLFFYSGLHLRAWTTGVSMTVISSVLMCLNFAMQYVCGNLLMFVDAFCCRVSEEEEIERISLDWNVLQAVLRKGASSIEFCFVWIQGTMALAVPLAIADLAVYGVRSEVIAMLVPRFVLFLHTSRTLFAAASLTSKCDSVPSVVNALHFGPHTDSLRQHIVNYIASSAAGFHVYQARVSMWMVIKYVYIWGVVAFALSTRFLAI